MVSPYKAGNYHLNENEPGKYFQGVEKSKIKKMQIGAWSTRLFRHGAEEWVNVRGPLYVSLNQIFSKICHLEYLVWLSLDKIGNIKNLIHLYT